MQIMHITLMISATFICAPELAFYEIVLPSRSIRSHAMFATKWREVPRQGAKINISLPMLQPEAVLSDFYIKIADVAGVSTIMLAKEIKVDSLQLEADFALQAFPSKQTLNLCKIVHLSVSPAKLDLKERCEITVETADFVYKVNMQYCDTGYVIREPIVLDSFEQLKITFQLGEAFLLDFSNCSFKEDLEYYTALEVKASKTYNVQAVLQSRKFNFLKFRNQVFNLDIITDYRQRNAYGYVLSLEGACCLYSYNILRDDKITLQIADCQANIEENMMEEFDANSIGVCKRELFRCTTNNLLSIEMSFAGVAGNEASKMHFIDFLFKPIGSYELCSVKNSGVLTARELFNECELDFSAEFSFDLPSEEYHGPTAVEGLQRTSYEQAFSELNDFYCQVLPGNDQQLNDDEIFEEVKQEMMNSTTSSPTRGNGFDLPLIPIETTIPWIKVAGKQLNRECGENEHVYIPINHSTLSHDGSLVLSSKRAGDLDEELPSPIVSQHKSDPLDARKEVMSQDDRNSLVRIGEKIPSHLLYTDEIMKFIDTRTNNEEISQTLKKARLEEEIRASNNKFLSKDIEVALHNILQAKLARESRTPQPGIVQRKYFAEDKRGLMRTYE